MSKRNSIFLPLSAAYAFFLTKTLVSCPIQFHPIKTRHTSPSPVSKLKWKLLYEVHVVKLFLKYSIALLSLDETWINFDTGWISSG